MNSKILLGAGLSAFAIMLAAKEPVVMTVDGVDVPKSEFEYLYHKNSQQQMAPQPIEDYVELFKLYKLKVADARAEGLDTLASFRREMAQYRHDLAAPYLNDSTYIFQLLDEAAKRAEEEVEANHIMLFKTRDGKGDADLRQRADSLKAELDKGADFADLAARFSGDRGSNTRGGSMGYITALQYPYEFETVAYTLPEGKISDVVESPMGYHILKGGKHRKASGEVLASHILIMAQGEDANGRAKHLADSLYNIVKVDPSQFADIARRYSDDKGSGKEGGKLPWFGRGRMVPEFEETAFSMADGTISEPFKTKFGYHIIQRHDHKGAPSAQELKPKFLYVINSGADPRGEWVKENQTKRLEKKHKGKMNADVENLLLNSVANGLDSTFYTSISGDNTELFKIGKKSYPAGGVKKFLGKRQTPDGISARKMMKRAVEDYYNNALVETEEEALLVSRPEYGNLYREYVDGSLLYEVSSKKVWDKAAKDEAGLQKYFDENRDKYIFDRPRAKGYLVQATTDSVAQLVRERAAKIGRDTLVNTIRKEFPREVSIAKVLEVQGPNEMIDNICFGGSPAKTSNPKYTTYFMIDPRVITAAEDIQDVRGNVISDYQAVLQEEWEKELKSKYPVKLNEKELKKVSRIKK